MRTFCIQTLGCKVNQYESEQLAALLRAHGLTEAGPGRADLRIINTCSVTVAAASKSRQSVRKATRLPVLNNIANTAEPAPDLSDLISQPDGRAGDLRKDRPRVIVTGCWATSDREQASRIPGVDAVLTHHQDVADELERLLARWQNDPSNQTDPADAPPITREALPEPQRNEEWMNTTKRRESAAGNVLTANKPFSPTTVKNKLSPLSTSGPAGPNSPRGTHALPLLSDRQSAHQRAFLKIQDGCDAHCTYCIIPSLRPTLWSKPPEDVLREARQLLAAGHRELVLTGIFLGAYGHPTALRRRQLPADHSASLSSLLRLLCTSLPSLHRLRLSSLEPGDLDDHLAAVMRDLPQVVPHFHLPLQSGSQRLLRRMNRQYTRDDYLRMIDRVHRHFDRPAITTDIIVGFPGESEEEFDRTLEVVEHARFIHIHAFPFSPRPGTAAARWTRDFVHGPLVPQRIAHLTARAAEHSETYRREFVGQAVELLVERQDEDDHPAPHLRHGRSPRYFPVHFPPTAPCSTGDLVRVRIDAVTPTQTLGTLLEVA